MNTLADIVTSVTPGEWELRRAGKPDNTGGYDWAIVAPGKAIIAECFEHVDWRQEGVTYDVRPAEAHARLFAMSKSLATLVLEAREALRIAAKNLVPMAECVPECPQCAEDNALRATLAKLEAL